MPDNEDHRSVPPPRHIVTQEKMRPVDFWLIPGKQIVRRFEGVDFYVCFVWLALALRKLGGPVVIPHAGGVRVNQIKRYVAFGAVDKDTFVFLLEGFKVKGGKFLFQYFGSKPAHPLLGIHVFDRRRFRVLYAFA